jgi:hypothetical protein
MLEKFVTRYCKKDKIPYCLDLEWVKKVFELFFDGVAFLVISIVVVEVVKDIVVVGFMEDIVVVGFVGILILL